MGLGLKLLEKDHERAVVLLDSHEHLRDVCFAGEKVANIEQV